MGGYLIADMAVWFAFLQVFLEQWPVDFVVPVSIKIRQPFWECLYDRFAFLQVNDPLLI